MDLMPALRVCEKCGTKMPFGVRRRVIDGKKVCGGCAAGREGRPLTNHQGSLGPACPACGSTDLDWGPERTDFHEWQCRDCGQRGSQRSDGSMNPAHMAARTAAPTPPQFLQDPKITPKDPEGPITDLPDEGQVLPAGASPPPPPTVPGSPMPGTSPNGGLGSFAPDRESDKVVRVCPFCGSGQIVGQSDGSIECGHEGVTFLVEVLPKHPFQPLVDEQGNPFEMNVEGDEPVPEIGVARAADSAPAPPQAGDAPVDDEGDDEEDDDLPEFLKGASLYVTDQGTALNEDAYVEHLAKSLFG